MSQIKITAGSSARILGQLGVDLTGRTVQFIFERVPDGASDSLGFVVGLAAPAAETRSAVLVDAAAGQVQYTLTAVDTQTAGRYRAQFSYRDAQNTLQLFPATGWFYFEVQAFAAPASVAALADFCEPVRAVMGDFRTPYIYEDAALAGIVRTVVRCGHVPGYAITPDGAAITPSVGSTRDFALIVYHSARTLLRPKVREESWGSRALKVKRGNQRDFLRELENLVYYTENPEQLATFQSYYAWVNSLAGINVWGLMTEMKVNAPVARVSIGTGGIVVNTTT